MPGGTQSSDAAVDGADPDLKLEEQQKEADKEDNEGEQEEEEEDKEGEKEEEEDEVAADQTAADGVDIALISRSDVPASTGTV